MKRIGARSSSETARLRSRPWVTRASASGGSRRTSFVSTLERNPALKHGFQRETRGLVSELDVFPGDPNLVAACVISRSLEPTARRKVNDPLASQSESCTVRVARLRGDRHANYRYHYRCAVRRLQHHSCS